MVDAAPGALVRQRRIVLCTPVLLIALCHMVQRLSAPVFGDYAVVATLLVFWACIGGMVLWSVGRDGVRRWFGASQGVHAWRWLALLLGLLSLPAFITHWQVLRVPAVAAFWLVFALVNPWLEEAYWRGLLVDAARGWGAWLGIGHAAFWFALSHPLVWGVLVPGMWKPEVVVALFVVGLLWGVAYHRTGSLRWPVAGHACANLFGLAGPVLLNLVAVGR